MFTLAYVIAQLGFPSPIEGAEDVRLDHVCIDSRQAREGSLFVALPGERTDGHLYVAQAFAAGAKAALIQREVPGLPTIDLTAAQAPERLEVPIALRVENTLGALQRLAKAYRRDHPHLRVVGVTGSVGKTTAKEAIATVLAQRFVTLKNEGNANNEIGLPLTLLTLMPHHERAVLEMAMYAVGEIALLCDLAQPTLGVVMNVGPTHLERLGSIERIAQAKAELVQALLPEGLAILNGDDPRVRAMSALTSAPVVTFGLGPENDLCAFDVQTLGLGGIVFEIAIQTERFPEAPRWATVHTPLLGSHAVMPALAAVAVGLAEGLCWEEITRGLEKMGSPRLMPKRLANGALLLDDTYNASPASCQAALDLLASLAGRRIAVLGDMLELGDYEREAHREVGAMCASRVEHLITVGSRARWIAESAREAGLAASNITEVETNQEALDLLKTLLREGDVVLVKGSRGMAMEEIVHALEARE